MKSFLLSLLLVAIIAGNVTAEETQIVAGAGPSTEIAQLFFDALGRREKSVGTKFVVIQASVKHLGGIKNSDTYLFGRTGRPLSADEKNAGKREILLGGIPTGIAVGLEAGVRSLTLEQLRAIYSRKISNWKEVGGADATIFLAGREPKEAVYSSLKADYPWFGEVTFDQVFQRDDNIKQFIVSPQGRHAIVFGSVTQLPERQLVKVEGFDTGVRVGLVYDQKNESHPTVQAAKRFSTSSEWQEMVKNSGLIPVR